MNVADVIQEALEEQKRADLREVVYAHLPFFERMDACIEYLVWWSMTGRYS